MRILSVVYSKKKDRQQTGTNIGITPQKEKVMKKVEIR